MGSTGNLTIKGQFGSIDVMKVDLDSRGMMAEAAQEIRKSEESGAYVNN